jgi:hypothetical protein
LLTRARSRRPATQFKSDDFPEFDRPASAISASDQRGYSAGASADPA